MIAVPFHDFHSNRKSHRLYTEFIYRWRYTDKRPRDRPHDGVRESEHSFEGQFICNKIFIWFELMRSDSKLRRFIIYFLRWSFSVHFFNKLRAFSNGYFKLERSGSWKTHGCFGFKESVFIRKRTLFSASLGSLLPLVDDLPSANSDNVELVSSDISLLGVISNLVLFREFFGRKSGKF